jgi:uncharacterized repeat protein (TIGR01451 family)
MRNILNDYETMTTFALSSRLLRAVLPALLVVFTALTASQSFAQTIYGIGSATAGAGGVAPFDTLYSINPANGAATVACTAIAGFTSAAIGVNNSDGLIYAFSQGAAPTTVRAINPSTCAVTTPPNLALTLGTIIRAASCPDGRFYVMSNTTQFFEITPSTGATVRTLTFTGLPAGGSGDFSCASNNVLYIIAADGTANYNLYSASAASFSAVPSGSNVAVTDLGDVGLAGAPNGIAEAPLGGTGCAAAPTPCLVVSTGATNQTWGINATSGVATSRGTTGFVITDLSRSFPVDLSIVKSVTPTVALQGQTVVYTLNVSNLGPAAVGGTTVTDSLSAAFASALWSCSVNTAGTATSVTTACGAASGTGNINTSASFSLGGSLIYRVTATLSSTFTGTATNVAVVAPPGGVVDPVPGNNVSTVTSTVSPATALSITKTNGTTTVVAGQTTSYTVTVSNLGPGNAPNSVVKDPVGAGLSCTAATCTVASGTATCPAGTPTALMTALQSGAGAIIPTFNAGSTINFLVTCGVTATGQ